MSKVPNNDPGRLGPETVPPFWLHADEEGPREIDQRVLEVSRKNWVWAFWLVTKELNDGPRTREIVEDVAVDVSNRLRVDDEVGRNLNAYFKISVIRAIKTIATRESRITYEGRTQDLEAIHQLRAPDWTRVFEDRMVLEALLPYMTAEVKQILYYRQLDYSWKHIANRLSLTEKQAKSRFYYGAHQAHNELLAAQATRARRRESEE